MALLGRGNIFCSDQVGSGTVLLGRGNGSSLDQARFGLAGAIYPAWISLDQAWFGSAGVVDQASLDQAWFCLAGVVDPARVARDRSQFSLIACKIAGCMLQTIDFEKRKTGGRYLGRPLLSGLPKSSSLRFCVSTHVFCVSCTHLLCWHTPRRLFGTRK